MDIPPPTPKERLQLRIVMTFMFLSFVGLIGAVIQFIHAVRN